MVWAVMTRMTHNIIAIDGINGMHVKECTNFISKLFNDDVEVTTFHFPDYDSPIGQFLKKYLDEKIELEPFIVHTLFALNRFERKQEIIEKSKSDLHKRVAIIDRYFNSGYCYAQASGLTPVEMSTLQNIDLHLPFPRCMIYLQSEPNPKKKNRFEQDLDYLKKVKSSFNTASTIYGWEVIERLEYRIKGQTNLKRLIRNQFPTLLNSS